MDIVVKRTLENRFIDWKVLLTFLNANAPNTNEFSFPSLLIPVNPTPAQRKRTIDLIRMMHELERAKGAEARVLEDSINGQLAKYPIHFELRKHEGNLFATIRVPRKPFKATERNIVAMLVELAKMGSLSLLRQCAWKDCEEWFRASRKDQKFHAVPCKRKHEASSDEFKARVAKYQRDRYRLLMQKNGKRTTKGRR